MEQSLLAAVSGIDANQTYLDVIGNNIANSNSTGYQSENADFSDLLTEQLSGASAPGTAQGGVNPLAVGTGVQVDSISEDQTPGATQQTGVPTNVAIQGSGYLVVQENGQQYYTRDGNLNLDGAGNLVTPSGALVQGWQAAAGGTITATGATTGIKIPSGLTDSGGAALESYSVGADGVITGTFADGTTQAIAQIALASVPNPGGLADQGNSLYSATANSGTVAVGTPGANGTGTLLGGSLETSNVDLSSQLTNLIVAQEAYEANTKVVSTTSTALQALMSMQ